MGNRQRWAYGVATKYIIPKRMQEVLTVDATESFDLSKLTPRVYKNVKRSLENGYCEYYGGTSKIVYEKLCDRFGLPMRTFAVRGYSWLKHENKEFLEELLALTLLANGGKAHPYRNNIHMDGVSSTYSLYLHIETPPPRQAIERIFRKYGIDLGERLNDALACLAAGETLTFKVGG